MSDVRLTRRGRRLLLHGVPADDELAATIAGATWARGQHVWTYPATAGIAAKVVEAHKAAGLHVGGDGQVHELVQAWEATIAAAGFRVASELPDVPSGSPYPAWHHQRQAFYFGRECLAAILQMGMGTGKSKVACDLAAEWQTRTAVVLCPRRARGVWPREFERHALGDWIVSANVRGKRGGLLKAPSAAQRLEQFEADLERGRLLGHGVVLVLTYEASWREPLASFLLGLELDLAVLDEGHRARAAGGRAGRFTNKLRDRARRRLVLTGTLQPHTPLDVYTPCRFAEPALFGLNASAFRAEYGEPKRLSGGMVLTDGRGQPVMAGLRADKVGKFTEQLATITFECASREVLDLPEVLADDVPVPLGPEASRAYRELDEELITAVAGGTITAENALTRLLRLQQITSGHVAVQTPCEACGGLGGGNGDTTLHGHLGARCGTCSGTGMLEQVKQVGTEKADAFADLLADLPGRRTAVDGTELEPEPVVGFCRFTSDLTNMRAAAGAERRPYAELSGREESLIDHEAVMVAGVEVGGVQIQAGGVGVDLTRARHAVYYSAGFSLTDYDQSLARLERPSEHVEARRQEGEHVPIYALHLVAELDDGTATVDRDVYDALAARREVVEFVLERLRERMAVAA